MALDHIKNHRPTFQVLFNKSSRNDAERMSLKTNGNLYIYLYLSLFLSLPLLGLRLQGPPENATAPFIEALWLPYYAESFDWNDNSLILSSGSVSVYSVR